MSDLSENTANIAADALSKLAGLDQGLIDRGIYIDPEIHKLEMRRLFARAWNFMCHESQIANVGDYFINYIGDDQVIVVRDRNGKVQVLLNSCAHRGNALCRAEMGNAKSFVCSYHGWNFSLDGRLIGIPGKAPFYRDQIDTEKWGRSAHAPWGTPTFFQISGFRHAACN
jgi:phenylpropionate dioxygenase-like ring-hydroxylating dioxygenase large terminal subunit